MAKLNFVELDLDELIPTKLLSDEMVQEMLVAGQEILYKNIRQASLAHVDTGAMMMSLRKSQPTQNEKDGTWKIHVRFSGTVPTRKGGAIKYNAYKALWLEYGTKNMNAQPFVRPAVQRSKQEIIDAMNKIVDSTLRKVA